MRKSIIISLIICLLLLFSCKTTKNLNEKTYYTKGNVFGPFGRKMSGDRLAEILINIDPTNITRAVLEFRWPVAREDYKFKRFEGESTSEGYSAMYTGQLVEGGDTYTWGYKTVYINSLKELIAELGFLKPAYVTVDKKSMPLTAIINEDGTLSSGVGVKTTDYLYVCTDTIENADIWYYYNPRSNKIRNKGLELGAVSVAVAECSYAQAEYNLLILKDIARLTKCIEITEADLNNDDYDDMLKNLTQDKLDMLNDSLRKKVAIQSDLQDAITASRVAIVSAGADFVLQITQDVLKLARWSNPMSSSFNPVAIANYWINLYGDDEESQKYGKIAQENSGKNINKGKEKMNQAKKILDKQAKILKLIKEDSKK